MARIRRKLSSSRRDSSQQGYPVSLFLAGEAVTLLKPEVRYSLNDLGTGNLREHYDALVKAGVRFYVSGMSAKARGLGPELLTNTPAEFALPDRLLKRSLAHDRQFTY